MNKRSGQVTVFVALMMLAFVSAAALCINASYAFHQHTQMQAQVDTSTLYAGSEGCKASSTTVDGGVLTIGTPIAGGPYAGDDRYCEGIYQKSPGSLFGKIIKFPFKLSVRAVGLHGGSTEPYFAMLGLSTVGDSHGCSIDFQDASMVASITGDAYSDSSKNFTACGGNRNISFTSPYTYTGNSSLYDPFQVAMPTTGSTSVTTCSGIGSGRSYVAATLLGCSSTINEGCLTASVPITADNYYQANSSGVTEIAGTLGDNSKLDVYLPSCSGSTTVPGIFLLDGGGGGGEAISDNSSSQTFVVSSTVALASTVNKVTFNGAVSLTSPNSGPYAGYSIYQENYSNPCTSPVPAQFKATPIVLEGLLDLGCSDITFSGSGAYDLTGSVVGYTITFAGSSAGNAVFHKPPISPPRGSFLVQ